MIHKDNNQPCQRQFTLLSLATHVYENKLLLLLGTGALRVMRSLALPPPPEPQLPHLPFISGHLKPFLQSHTDPQTQLLLLLFILHPPIRLSHHLLLHKHAPVFCSKTITIYNKLFFAYFLNSLQIHPFVSATLT